MGRASVPQSYTNHRASVPWPFLLAGAVIALDVLRRAWLAWRERDLGFEHGGVHLWYVVLLSAVLLTWYYARRNAQIVQDRTIRLEMRWRLERVLGAARRADLERLSLGQLVALRFAGDAELGPLVDEILQGRLVEPDDIKRRIQDWQPDWLRV